MMFSRSALLLSSLLLIFGVHAGPVYKCVAENGKVTYSDKACPDAKAEKLDIENRPTDPAAVKARSAARKEKVEAILESNQKSAEAKAEARKEKEEKQQACAQARERLTKMMDARRLYKTEGEERQYLSSEEIDATRKAAQDKIKELCD